jgi:outer membrane protein assembly factor BamB
LSGVSLVTGLSRKDETDASREHRYYKRVTPPRHTTSWGVLLAFGLQLPLPSPPPPPTGQNVPAAETRPADVGPYTHAWTRPAPQTEQLLLDLSASNVFTAGEEAPLQARSLSTGDVVWTHELATWQSIAATDTLVFGVSGDFAYALDESTGRTRWVTQTTGTNTRLTAARDRLLMTSDVDVLLRDANTGESLWHQGLPAPPAAPASLGDTSVAVPLKDGSIISFDIATGTPRWLTRLDAPALAVTAHASATYVGLADAAGSLCMLRDRDGDRRWCFSFRVPVTGPPLVTDDVVRVPLLDNTLRSLDRVNGAMRRQDSLGHRPGAGPWLTRTSIVVALTTGEFLVLDRTTGTRTARLSSPSAGGSHLLERAAVSRTGHALVSLTILPGGERRLTLYRPAPLMNLPITRDPSVFFGVPIGLPAPPSPGGATPRPFPEAR